METFSLDVCKTIDFAEMLSYCPQFEPPEAYVRPKPGLKL
jgi:hypothetical protein